MIPKTIKNIFSDKLVKNIGWQTASQIFTRIIRIATVVVLARNLTTEDYGLMAILFAITDFANVFIQKGGVAPKLIQASPEELEELIDSAYWINWIICISIFILQCMLAFPIALFYEKQKLVLPIIVAGCAYLVNPSYAIQDALIRRENRLKISALASAIKYTLTHILLIVFAIMGLGVWSIVLSLVIGQSVWFTVYRMNHTWRPTRKFTLKGWKDIFNFSKFPLGIEMLNSLRSNIDYLLIGKFFSVEQLGIYFFAFNAGLGISLTAINMISNSVFPYLCEIRNDLKKLKYRYIRSLKVCAAIIFPLVLVQSSLAPIYVPIVFGEKWIPAIPILIIICLSALPRPFALVSEQLLLVIDRGMGGLKWSILFTIIFAVGITFASQFNILTVAVVVLGIHALCLPLFSLLVSRAVFSGKRLFSFT